MPGLNPPRETRAPSRCCGLMHLSPLPRLAAALGSRAPRPDLEEPGTGSQAADPQKSPLYPRRCTNPSNGDTGPLDEPGPRCSLCTGETEAQT